MKILFVVNEIPFPPDNGVRIVSHHAMRLMHDAGHELALAVLTAEEDKDLEARFQRITNLCKPNMAWWMPLPTRSRLSIQFMSTLTNRLFFVERYRCQKFRRKLKQLIADFKPDVVHFDIITMAQYRDVASKAIGTVASINDSVSLTLENQLTENKYEGLSQSYRLAQLRQARRYEASIYPKFNAVHVMSDIDANYLKKLNPHIHTAVIPNGADSSLLQVGETPSHESHIIFVAKLFGDNIKSLESFLYQSWPRICQECPEVVLHVVGKMDADALTMQSRNSAVKNVKFCGYVENLAKIYNKCGIAIVPINKDCGIINKAIEAMAAGLAVVGFVKTFAGIKGAVNGEHYLAAEDYAGISQAIVQLICNKDLRESIQHSAHDLAKRAYSWHTRGNDYEKMYRAAQKNAAQMAN